ncbi:hypothetical protein FRC02_008863 [Tulasnella sp. 418]|nr:hypothetical protein FRC02_008863 [Tulasnella sp. 418]
MTIAIVIGGRTGPVTGHSSAIVFNARDRLTPALSTRIEEIGIGFTWVSNFTKSATDVRTRFRPKMPFFPTLSPIPPPRVITIWCAGSKTPTTTTTELVNIWRLSQLLERHMGPINSSGPCW